MNWEIKENVVHSTTNFIVIAPPAPHIDRLDGGHLIIAPKVRVKDRTFLSVELAIELMLLTMVVGEAMSTALNACGVDIGRINYQDNGNWGVNSKDGSQLHVHIYGRAVSANTQKFGEALFLPKPETGFYKNVLPLKESDLIAISKEIKQLLNGKKFKMLMK